MIAGLEVKYMKLKQSLEDIIVFCDKLTEAQRAQRQENKWSPIQILFHLSVSEIGTTHYLQKKMKAKPNQVNRGGIKSFLRSILLNAALKMNKTKFKAPKELAAVPDKPDYQKTKIRLQNNRILLEELLNQFDVNMAKKAYFKHPLVGRLNVYQTLDFLNAHFERHAKQIKDLIKA